MVTLSAIGLSPQEGTVVNVVANLMAALDYSVRVLDTNDASGDIVLINPASEAGRATLANLGQAQRVVLFVDSEGEAHNYPVLIRPVRVQTLRDLLVDLVPGIPPQDLSMSQVKPAVLPSRQAVDEPPATSPRNLFYLLLEAAIGRTMLRIDNSTQAVVLVHGPTQCIYTQADSAALDQISKQSPHTLHMQELTESDFMRAAKGMSLTRLHDVIWLAERNGSHGVLLQGHSLEVPVRLKVWPKFNNRHVRPEYLKLAALLSRQPLTLRTLAESSGVQLPYVIDFYNAVVAFGVIETMEAAPVVKLPANTSTNSGLLGKIAKRLALKRE